MYFYLLFCRSIGVGGIVDQSVSLDRRREDTSSPTGSLTGTLRRRVRTFETGIQVNECEFNESMLSVPLLQIVERVDFGTQVSFDESKSGTKEEKVLPEPKKTSYKTIGITAKPTTTDVCLGFKV